MIAGFQGHVRRRAPGVVTCASKREHLGVRFSRFWMEPFAHDVARVRIDDDASDNGVWERFAIRASRERKSTTHVRLVLIRRLCGWFSG